jgi:proteasome accessory factor B
MVKSESLKRYILIVNKLSSKQKPTLVELRTFLEDHDVQVSERTLQRDLEALRINIGIDIEYDNQARGYTIRMDQRFSLDNFMRIARLKLRSDLLASAIDDLQHNQDYISVDNNDKLKGLEHMESILEAIQNRRVIAFDYTKFSDSKTKRHEVEPYHLKEYDGRWYLLGLMKKGMTLYSLDRFDNLQVTTKVYNRNPKINPKEQFLNQIGVSWGETEQPELVKLQFDNAQADYVETLPWHDSQETIETYDKGIVVSYNLVINYEFIHKIISFAEHVIVLEPKSLAVEVAVIHRKAVNQYS